MRGFHDPSEDPYGAVAPPIKGITGDVYTSIAYVFSSAAEAAATFAGEPGARDYAYSRIGRGQPPIEELRQRLLDLELGEDFPRKEQYDVVLTSSGMSAIFLLALQFADQCRTIITSPRLYGGSYHLLKQKLPRLGLQCHMVRDPLDLSEWRHAAEEHGDIAFLFAEDDANPKPIKLDNAGIAAIAHEHGTFYACDRTIGTPILEQPLRHGTDIVVHSLSKNIGGRSEGLGGALIGRRDLIAQFSDKDRGWFACTGMVMDARVADYMLAGVRDLKERMAIKLESAPRIVAFLQTHPRVSAVHHTDADVLAFDVRGSAEDAARVVESFRLILMVPHLGDIRSLSIPPTSTTHSPMSREDRLRHGITDTLIRLSLARLNPNRIARRSSRSVLPLVE
ncbi:PLP-dependent transferase, partial [Candidatus Peregrinibacteria bacterium]|nr:PLP-dependent transferase [Candidatus Peregrinibacteria bacterium]